VSPYKHEYGNKNKDRDGYKVEDQNPKSYKI